KEDHFDSPQQTKCGPDEDTVTVEFNAFLRNSVSFLKDEEDMWICMDQDNHRLKMDYLGYAKHLSVYNALYTSFISSNLSP
ncbi:hypothetical protein AALO_G00032640, partial [Alosa alosa]